jgi:hypothetical protein
MPLRDDRRFRLLTPALVVGLCALGGTAQAQFFGDRYYGNDGYNNGYGGYQQRYQRPREDFNFPFGDRFMRPAPPPADYSKAPGPRKLDTPPTTNIVVIGDSLADWLAYGLDETYSDQPDTGVVRKIKPTSGLVRYDAKNENLDWAGAIKDTLAGERPNAIVVMLGLNDRTSLKDRIPPKPVPPKPGEAPAAGQAQGQAQGQTSAAPGQAPNQAPAQPGPGQAQEQKPAPGQAQKPAQNPPQAQEQKPPQGQAQKPGQSPPQNQSQAQSQSQPPAQGAAAAQGATSAPQAAQFNAADSEGGKEPSTAPPVASGGTFDFHTDKWAEVYGRRVDEMIAALKLKGVPILWVGVPSLRGTKSTSDMAYLDEIYRERAEKAGIAYVDIWDGFVDEQGRYTVQGPDFEGQTRKLRTPDGVHFTKAGAVKLASYVDQELRRVMSKGVIAPVALPGPDTTAPKPAAAVGGRPDAGPVVPLVSGVGGGDSGDLAGGGRPAQLTSTDPVAAKVLSRGDAIAAPNGRADDFAWPRRGNAPPTTSDTGPLPGPEQPAPPPAPKKADKAADAKGSDKAGDKSSDKTKSSQQDQSKPRRSQGATLDGGTPPRPPRDVGGGF